QRVLLPAGAAVRRLSGRERRDAGTGGFRHDREPALHGHRPGNHRQEPHRLHRDPDAARQEIPATGWTGGRQCAGRAPAGERDAGDSSLCDQPSGSARGDQLSERCRARLVPAARPRTRKDGPLHARVSGRERRDAALRAALQLQLAAHVPYLRENPEGRQDARAVHLRQFDRQQVQPRPGQVGLLRRSELGGDGHAEHGLPGRSGGGREQLPDRAMTRISVVSGVLLLVAAAAHAAQRQVSVTAGEGFALQGSYYSAEKGGPGILLLHQCDADRRIYDQLATMLNVAGYNVLTIDWRGFGGSRGGAFTDFRAQRQKILELMPGDVDAALKFLSAQSTVINRALGVVGGSCGVNQAVQASRRHPEIRTLVLLSGGTDAQGEAHIKS